MGTIEESLLNGVNKMIDRKLENYTPKDVIEGQILTINVDGTSDVLYLGQTLSNVPVREGLSLSVGQIVIIKIMYNNFSFKYVDLVRPW